jgi:hypothetical protein
MYGSDLKRMRVLDTGVVLKNNLEFVVGNEIIIICLARWENIGWEHLVIGRLS